MVGLAAERTRKRRPYFTQFEVVKLKFTWHDTRVRLHRSPLRAGKKPRSMKLSHKHCWGGNRRRQADRADRLKLHFCKGAVDA